jgi:hypothetical protein
MATVFTISGCHSSRRPDKLSKASNSFSVRKTHRGQLC